ncbi:MAG: transporter [Longimicrobiales bacterium]|nr:transporter [Longimicrobiales bacterium]
MAQSLPPDRPGIGSGATVLAPGIVHLETGLAYSGGAPVDTYSFGQVLVRAGLAGVELEVFANSFVVARSETFPTLDDEGFQDAGVGLKIPVARDVGGRMNVSLQGVLTAPTGSDGFGNDEWIGALNALADIGLSDQAGLSVNLGVQEGVAGGDEVVSVVVTPGMSLSDAVGAYAGWAGFFSGGGDTNFGEAGVTFLASPDLQLDVNGGWALDGDEWFLGAGAAIRWGPN